jgi:hypothetical protein
LIRLLNAVSDTFAWLGHGRILTPGFNRKVAAVTSLSKLASAANRRCSALGFADRHQAAPGRHPHDGELSKQARAADRDETSRFRADHAEDDTDPEGETSARLSIPFLAEYGPVRSAWSSSMNDSRFKGWQPVTQMGEEWWVIEKWERIYKDLAKACRDLQRFLPLHYMGIAIHCAFGPVE